MRYLLIIICMVLIIPSAKSQAFLEKIRSGNANFYEVMKEYEDWVKEHGELTKAEGRNEVRRFFRDRFFDSDENGDPIQKQAITSIEYMALKSARKSMLKSVNAGPEWTPFGPLKLDCVNSTGYNPGHAVIRCIVPQPGNSNVLYAGSVSAGIWKTLDGGASWTHLTPNEPVSDVFSMAVGSNNTSFVLAGATNFGVMRSYDAGQNWELTSLSYADKSVGRIQSIQLDPADDDHIVVGTDKGVYTSFDGGNSWEKPAIEGKNGDVAIHPTNGNIVYVLNITASSQAELYKSTDGGKSFTEKTVGLPGKEGYTTSTYGRLAVTPAAPENVYLLLAGKYDGGSGLVGVYTSTDEGEIFAFQCCGNQPGGKASLSNKNLLGYNSSGTEDGGQWSWDLAFEVSRTDAQKVYVGGILLWISSDQGKNFSCYGGWSVGSQDRSKYIHCDIQSIYDAGDKLFLTSDGGVYMSENGGGSFVNITNGISGTETWAPAGLSRINPNIAIMGTYHNGILYAYDETTPDGWRHVYGGDSQMGKVNLLDHIFSNDGGGNTRVSKDGGKTWNAFGGKTGMNFETSPACVNHIAGVATGNIYLSYDGGGSFTEVYTTNETGGYTYEHGQIAYAPSNPDIIYGSYYYGRKLVKSIDGGLTWSQIESPLAGMKVYDIEVDPQDAKKVYVTNMGYRSGSNVFCSTDGGYTWSNFSEGLGSVNALSLKCQAGTEGGIYLGTDGNGVFYRNNTLGKWVDYTGNLPLKTKVIGLHVNYAYNKLYVTSGGRGIWTTSLYESSNHPLAGVSADKLELHTPGEKVQFYENSFYSKDSDVSFEWTFPGGTPASSTEANPQVAYSEAGSYDVTLKVTDKSGTHTTTANDLIVMDEEAFKGYQAEAKTAVKMIRNGYATVAPFNKEFLSMTMSCWIKSSGDQSSYAGILFHRSGSDSNTAGINFRDNNELGYHWGGSKYDWSSGVKVPYNEWCHVALVVEPTKATLYFNGKAYVNNQSHRPNLFDGILKIGADYAQSREYAGLIDEVKIWDRALTADEIQQQRYITAHEEDQLFAYYQFNETNEKYIYDSTGKYTGSKPMDLGRVISSAPVAGGFHASHLVSGNMINFEGTSAALKSTYAQKWNVNKLNARPNDLTGIPEDAQITTCYWIIEPATLNKTVDIELSLTDEQVNLVNDLSTFSLYGRDFNGERSWLLKKEDGVYNAKTKTVLFNGVTHSGQFILVIQQGTGLTEYEAAQVKLWPNPVTSNMTIEWAKPEDLRYQIYNASGQMIYYGVNHGKQKFTINFSGIKSGHYLIRILDNTGYSLTKRFVVK